MATGSRRISTARERIPGSPFVNTVAQMIDKSFRYWAIAPLLILLLIFSVFPILQLFRMSVSTAYFQEGQVVWQITGLENFHTFQGDYIFKTALFNTTYFVIVTVTIEMVFGFILALMASNLKRSANLYRTILIIPILVPPIAIGTVWRLMYNFDFGILNRFLNVLGLPSQTWVANPSLAMICVMLVDIWHWIPFIFLLMLAGLESLPLEPLEAARVDGASNRQLLRYVILPMLKPTILVTLMFRTIFAFKVFDEVYLLTGGGPGTRTEVISLYINRVYFSQFRWGYGAFLSIITIALIAIFIIVYNNQIRSRNPI